METCSVVLTFESVETQCDPIWCSHSNETSPSALLHSTICFSIQFKHLGEMKNSSKQQELKIAKSK